MALVRSEEQLERWLAGTARAGGAAFPATLKALARRWGWSPARPGLAPAPVAELQAILDEVGLRRPFWQLA
ncbi:MAG TPA: hypothetical protein VFB26_00130 [Gaiellaceae bacterium]|nr:hypothetical protein [Gaiellaceae bacterium]